MRKVLHIITRLDMGGRAQNTLNTCIGLATKSYDLVLVCGLSRESAMTEAEKKSVDRKGADARRRGVKIIYLPSLVRRVNPTEDLAALICLLRIIRRVHPDIVHTHTSKAGIIGRLAAWLSSVPVIVHTPHGHVFHGHFSKLLSKTFVMVERIFDKITGHTIALTDGERNDYINMKVSIPKKLSKIHSGVDLRKFMKPIANALKKRTALGIESTDIVVGTVGWLLPIKGPAYLLEAMPRVLRRHPDIKLMFVGKGKLETELKERADAMGVADRIIFTGWRDNIPELMHLFDIFVLPSLNEGMGRVIVEAMAAGKPVVASRTGGIPDLVIDGETGFLVDPGDSSGLAEAIGKLLEDPGLRQSMGQEGRKRCYLFSEELMIEKIDKLYQRLLN